MRIRITRQAEDEGLSAAIKIAGVAAVGALAATVFGVFLARDQMVRHQRDLFSPHPLRRERRQRHVA
jgi:hypothetical protein